MDNYLKMLEIGVIKLAIKQRQTIINTYYKLALSNYRLQIMKTAWSNTTSSDATSPNSEKVVWGDLVSLAPGLQNKIPAYKIFARGWVAQEPFFS